MNESIELKLPKTGYIVVISPFLTIGQSRELQKILLGKAEIDPTTAQLKKIPVETFLEMQDKAAELLIKEIKKGDKSQPFSKEWLSNLPVEDGNLIYDKINEITGAATLTPERKKK
ncbi:MAG: hypothetical protein ACTSYW_10505 [Candidatus Heimdallarchaeota archaeon]